MKKFGTYITTSLLTFMLMPMMAFAQEENFGEIGDFFDSVAQFINNVLIPLVFGIALLVFLYGVFQYFILGGADEESQKKGKGLMLYSIIGFVLMVSIFGIVNLVADGLGFSNDARLDNIPVVPIVGR